VAPGTARKISFQQKTSLGQIGVLSRSDPQDHRNEGRASPHGRSPLRPRFPPQFSIAPTRYRRSVSAIRFPPRLAGCLRSTTRARENCRLPRRASALRTQTSGKQCGGRRQLNSIGLKSQKSRALCWLAQRPAPESERLYCEPCFFAAASLTIRCHVVWPFFAARIICTEAEPWLFRRTVG